MHEPAGAARAVFVDPTGRRGRRVVRTCWVLGALVAAYIGLVVVSLLLPPSLSRLSIPGLGPVLPGPGAAVLGATEGVREGPEVLLAPTPTPSAAATRSARPTRSPRPDRTERPATRQAAVPSPAPATTSTGAPKPGRRGTSPAASASAAPTNPAGAEPPGQRRTPKPRPSRGRP